MKCPMCGYERAPKDEAPAWQCPSCKVAYLKAAAAVASFRTEPVVNKVAKPGAPIPASEAAVRVNVVAACSYAADTAIAPAASAALTTASFSGLSVTASMGCQLRV